MIDARGSIYRAQKFGFAVGAAIPYRNRHERVAVLHLVDVPLELRSVHEGGSRYIYDILYIYIYIFAVIQIIVK